MSSIHEKSPAGQAWPRRSMIGLITIAVMLGLVEFVHHGQTHHAAHAASLVPSDVYVTDGDTIKIAGERFRLVGFDAPETYRAQCASELALGNRATARLQQLINTGDVALERIACSCRPGTEGTMRCNYGRSCGILRIHGHDVGQVLIAEGLARPYVCGATSCPRRRPWC